MFLHVVLEIIENIVLISTVNILLSIRFDHSWKLADKSIWFEQATPLLDLQ